MRVNPDIFQLGKKMGISGISSTSVTSASSAQMGDAVSISVARKAVAIEQQMMEQLISSIPQPIPSTTQPPNLGQNINISV